MDNYVIAYCIVNISYFVFAVYRDIKMLGYYKKLYISKEIE